MFEVRLYYGERDVVCILMLPKHCDQCTYYRKGEFYISKEEAQCKLDEQKENEYELLEYVGMNKKALLRHKKCGYIFSILCFRDILTGRNRGCPKCYQFKSVGEQRIRDYLDKHQIQYIPQKTFAPLNKSKYRFDFFLPQYNLAIEYQGEQHYRDNGYFKDRLKTVQTRDLIKKEYCIANNIELLEIKYTELNNISAILDSRFNDQEQKHMFQNNQEKDIV